MWSYSVQQKGHNKAPENAITVYLTWCLNSQLLCNIYTPYTSQVICIKVVIVISIDISRDSSSNQTRYISPASLRILTDIFLFPHVKSTSYSNFPSKLNAVTSCLRSLNCHPHPSHIPCSSEWALISLRKARARHKLFHQPWMASPELSLRKPQILIYNASAFRRFQTLNCRPGGLGLGTACGFRLNKGYMDDLCNVTLYILF